MGGTHPTHGVRQYIYIYNIPLFSSSLSWNFIWLSLETEQRCDGTHRVRKALFGKASVETWPRFFIVIEWVLVDSQSRPAEAEIMCVLEFSCFADGCMAHIEPMTGQTVRLPIPKRLLASDREGIELFIVKGHKPKRTPFLRGAGHCSSALTVHILEKS